MSFRFRRSVKLAPGLRMNFSTRGVGMSVGKRGASVSMGPSGMFGNVSVPGSGLSYRSALTASPPNRLRSSTASPAATLPVKLLLQDDGTVVFCDESGAPLDPQLEKITKKHQGPVIREWLAGECEKLTKQIVLLDEVHTFAPSPVPPITAQQRQFDVPPPKAPTHRPMGILGWLFRSVRDRIDQENAEADREHREALICWEQEKATWEATEADNLQTWERRLDGDTAAMQTVLELRLATIDWPRETTVSFEIPDASTVLLDVDLPEIEDLPTRTATVPARGWRLSIKPLSERRIRELYMRHVHGIAIRLAGEVFAALPTVQTVTLSGYSQRPDSATGRIVDEYLYSVRISRAAWHLLDFENLSSLDPLQALTRFELRRKLSRSGVFQAILPFAEGASSS